VNSNLSSAPFNYFAYLTNLSDGEHTITVNAFASAFEYIPWYSRPTAYTISNYSLVHITVDTASPEIQISSIENKTYFSPNFQLNFTVNQPVSRFSYVLDALENVTVIANSTLPDLPIGLHNVTVYAWDAAGNVGTSESITFTIAESFPAAFVAAASIGSIASVCIGLLVYLKKRHR
jgi:hypothetical protein